jgi:DNA-binding LacI/PurR family transcriptional regulator
MKEKLSMSGTRVTLKDVAERAGVSRSAVSRTFTEGASISNGMRRKVEKAADELGYCPNVLASSLTTRRTKLIGLVADNFTNPVFLTVIDLFTRTLQEKGYRPLIVNLSGEVDPSASVRLLRQYSVEGAIIASSTVSASFSKAFRRVGVPVVHAFGRASGHPAAHVVGVDNAQAGGLAAGALLARGYRHLGFLGGPKHATSTQDRLAGFLQTVRGVKGLRVEVAHATAYSYEAGRTAMATLIVRGGLAEAWFCGDDAIAIGALDALGEAGLRVPNDIGILGMNGIAMSGWRCIALTTIAQPIPEIIAGSVELVLSLVEEPRRLPEIQKLSCSIVERGSLRMA